MKSFKVPQHSTHGLFKFDKRKIIRYKCRSCKREWTTHNFTDEFCIFCKSHKITER